MSDALSDWDFDALEFEELRRRSGRKWGLIENDLIPAWIADKDFEPAPAITETCDPARRQLHSMPRWRSSSLKVGLSPVVPAGTRPAIELVSWNSISRSNPGSSI